MIEVENLSYSYKNAKFKAVDNISFSVAEGEIFGFLGPSGAGKSTTQKVLTKLLEGYEGKVRVFGKDLVSLGTEYYEDLGIGFELPNTYTKLSAVENLKFFRSFYKNKSVDIEALLNSVGLQDQKDERVEKYSKGMRMRLNFVRALVNDARLLFFDEPTSGLDPVNANIIQEMIKAERARGKTVFLTTHSMQAADALCNRVAFIVDGKIAEIGAPEALKLKYGKKSVELEYYADDNTIKTEIFGLGNFGRDPRFLDIVARHEVRRIHSQETTLEDVFITLTGRGLD